MTLFKKMKDAKKLLIYIYIVTLLMYLISLIFFTKSIFNFVGVETTIRILLIVLFYIFFLLYLLGGALAIVNKKKIVFTTITIIMLLLIAGFSFGSYYIDKIFNTINITVKEKLKYTSCLVTMKNTDFKNEKSTKIGMIANEEDIEGHILALKLINEKKLNKLDTVVYEDYIEMINALYKGDINGIFLSGNYTVMFGSEEAFENIENETEVKYSYSELLSNKDSVTASGKELTEPFSLLIIGVDSTSESMNANQSFNGDTLMLVTFNPHTLSSVIFSIPRDTYVPISCRKNTLAKINSSAYGGTACVINSIGNLTEINIDYYVKVNFKAVVELVNALNGVEVDIPIKFCEQDSNRQWGKNEICLNKGIQNLNGEQALAFARHRKTLPLADFQRIQHQQLVVEAVAKKTSKIRDINDFYNILEAISRNIETNMSSTQMLSFYEVGKSMLKKSLKGNDFISIEKTYLTGYGKSINGAYTFQYFKSSLNEIIDAMKVNLEFKKPKLIKSFSFSGNKIYETKVYGKVYEQVPTESTKTQNQHKEDKDEHPLNENVNQNNNLDTKSDNELITE